MNLAPNGKKSNLTNEQYRLVRTSAFKKWFGDWEKLANVILKDPAIDDITLGYFTKGVSKVVDENGEPLVVWHGSKSLFNEFTLLPETSEAGFHFGTLSQAQFRVKSSKEKYFYQCFLNIRNMIETTDMVFFSKHKISLKLQEQGIFTHEEYQNWHKFYDIIKEKKIDGLKYKNSYEGRDYSYMVLYPNQIKLADGTNTTFDGNSPNIRFDNGGKTENKNVNLQKIDMEKQKYCVVVVKFDNNVKKSTEVMPIQMAKEYVNRFVGKREEYEIFTCTADGEQISKIEDIQKYALGGGVDIVENASGNFGMFPENPKKKNMGVKMMLGSNVEKSVFKKGKDLVQHSIVRLKGNDYMYMGIMDYDEEDGFYENNSLKEVWFFAGDLRKKGIEIADIRIAESQFDKFYEKEFEVVSEPNTQYTDIDKLGLGSLVVGAGIGALAGNMLLKGNEKQAQEEEFKVKLYKKGTLQDTLIFNESYIDKAIADYKKLGYVVRVSPIKKMGVGGTMDSGFRSGEALMIKNPEKMPEYSTFLKKEYQTSVEEKRKNYQKWIPATFWREHLGHYIFIVSEPNGKHKQVTIPKQRTDLVKKLDEFGVGGTMDSSEDSSAPVLGGTMGSSMRKGGTVDEEMHSCSSCDAHVPLSETDNYGRCERCQEEYGEIKKVGGTMDSSMRDGGNVEEVDLFERYDLLPVGVQDILTKFGDMDIDYENCTALQNELEPLGYTFDWGLDAEPYGLRQIMKDENIMRDGGFMSQVKRMGGKGVIYHEATIGKGAKEKYETWKVDFSIDVTENDYEESAAMPIIESITIIESENKERIGKDLDEKDITIEQFTAIDKELNQWVKKDEERYKDINEEYDINNINNSSNSAEVEKEWGGSNYKNGGNVEEIVTHENVHEYKKLAPDGYEFSKKKFTALATKRLGGYWIHTANVNEKRAEIKADRAKGLTISDFDNDWLVKYNNTKYECLTYLKNNGFLKNAPKKRDGGNIKEADEVQTEISGLKAQKSSIMRGDGIANSVTRMIDGKVAKLQVEEKKLKLGGNMNTPTCERCGGATNSRTTMSMFNEDVICLTCKEKERNRPDYKKAVDADNEAIKSGNYNFKGIGLKKKDNDDISQYYDSEFEKGAFIPNQKQKQIITEKIGLSEKNADYLIEMSPKFAVWLADSIVKGMIDDYKRYDYDNASGKTPIEVKEYILNVANDKKINFIAANYRTNIRQILDWLMNPITPKQNLRELSFKEAEEKARQWHNELKATDGDFGFSEPEENEIIKTYPISEGGTQYYWVLIPKSYCPVEQARMGHCGRTGGDSLISLRSHKPFKNGVMVSTSHVTVAYDTDEALFYQVKGKENKKPIQKYHDYIFDLIKDFSKDEDHKFKGFGVEYDPKEDYGFEDMSKEQVEELYEINPYIFNDFEGEALLYDLGISSEKPNTIVTIEKPVEYVGDLLKYDNHFNDEFVKKVLTGEDTHEWSDGSWSYHYNNYKDLIGNLDKANEARIVKEIMRITKHTEKKVLENGIYEYTLGNVDDFHEDEFDNIVRAMVNAITGAEENAYIAYYYKQIEKALEELGTIEKLNYEGLVLEVDLSNSLTNRQISAYLKEVATLNDAFFEALNDGEIETPKLSIDDRYTPYASDKEFNAILAEIGLEDGYKLGGTTKKEVVQEKIGEVMHEFKHKQLRTPQGKLVTNPKQAIAIGYSEGRTKWKSKKRK